MELVLFKHAPILALELVGCEPCEGRIVERDPTQLTQCP